MRECVCLPVLMSQSEHRVLPRGPHSTIEVAFPASQTFHPNVKRTTTHTCSLYIFLFFADNLWMPMIVYTVHNLYVLTIQFCILNAASTADL